jgi:hypothetical protein
MMRALKHQTLVQALKKWQQEKPDLFVKRAYNHADLDIGQFKSEHDHADQHKRL